MQQYTTHRQRIIFFSKLLPFYRFKGIQLVDQPPVVKIVSLENHLHQLLLELPRDTQLIFSKQTLQITSMHAL
jgi:hypothetical protein